MAASLSLIEVDGQFSSVAGCIHSDQAPDRSAWALHTKWARSKYTYIATVCDEYCYNYNAEGGCGTNEQAQQ